MTEDQLTVRPFYVDGEGYEPRCIACHNKLEIRKPSQEEQQKEMNYYRETYDQNITKPEDVWAVTDTCECGQKGLVFFHVDVDTEK